MEFLIKKAREHTHLTISLNIQQTAIVELLLVMFPKSDLRAMDLKQSMTNRKDRETILAELTQIKRWGLFITIC
jgi:hypothetical protein